MDLLTFVSELIGSLAWPGTILLAVLLLRKEIQGLIPSLRHLKYRDLELDFRAQLEELEDRIAGAGEFEVEVIPDPEFEREIDQARAERLAPISPRAAVAEAWRGIEETLSEVAEKFDPEAPRASGRRLAKQLAAKGAISPSTASLLDEMGILRDQAVHAGEFTLNAGDAIEYADLAVRIRRQLYQGST